MKVGELVQNSGVVYAFPPIDQSEPAGFSGIDVSESFGRGFELHFITEGNGA